MEQQAITTEAAPFSMCRVHPLVVVSVLQHYLRRTSTQSRVFGVLLGAMDGDLVDLRNAFAVPCDDNGALDLKHLQSMLDLHRKASESEVLVGWYSTGTEINAVSALVHDQVWNEMRRAPLHLLVDAEAAEKPTVAAFYGSSMSISDARAVGIHWIPVPMLYDYEQHEHVAIRAVIQAARANGSSVPLAEVAGVNWSLDALATSLKDLMAWVAKVNAGEITADPKLGRLLLDAVSVVPVFDSGSFLAAFEKNKEDLSLLVQLSKLARQHLALSERLQRNASNN